MIDSTLVLLSPLMGILIGVAIVVIYFTIKLKIQAKRFDAELEETCRKNVAQFDAMMEKWGSRWDEAQQTYVDINREEGWK